MARLKIAILGAGIRGADYLRTASCLGDLYRPVGVCDYDVDRRDRLAAAYGVPGFSRLESMIANLKPDVLVVSIPADGHRAAVELSAERGVHIVCETPIAPTLPLADAMIAACQRHGVMLEIAENVWRWPPERLKQQIVRAGLIGDVTQVHLWYSTGSYHGISALRRLVGKPPTRVRGLVQEARVPPHVDRLGNRRTTAPYELGLIEFSSGAVCVYQLPLHPYQQNRWDVIGSAGALLGSDLILFRHGAQESFPIRQHTDETSDPPVLKQVSVETTSSPVVWENPYRHLPVGPDADDVARADVLCGIHRAIHEGGEPAYGPANARTDQEVLIAIRESALRDGAWIDLPLTDVTEVERRTHDQHSRRYGHDPLGPVDGALATLYPSVTPVAAALDPIVSPSDPST